MAKYLSFFLCIPKDVIIIIYDLANVQLIAEVHFAPRAHLFPGEPHVMPGEAQVLCFLSDFCLPLGSTERHEDDLKAMLSQLFQGSHILFWDPSWLLDGVLPINCHSHVWPGLELPGFGWFLLHCTHFVNGCFCWHFFS